MERVAAREVIDARRKSLGAHCLQDWAELAELAVWIDALKPRVVVEVGSCEFGWGYIMAPFFSPQATLVGIDPMTKPIIRREKMDAVIAKLRDEQFTVAHIEGHSDDNDVMRELVRILGGRKIDLLHIDGGHDYDTVSDDWREYSGYVRSGGIVAFHDVRSRAAAEQVYRVWDEIVQSGRWETELIGNQNRVGIGIVRI